MTPVLILLALAFGAFFAVLTLALMSVAADADRRANEVRPYDREQDSYLDELLAADEATRKRRAS